MVLNVHGLALNAQMSFFTQLHLARTKVTGGNISGQSHHHSFKKKMGKSRKTRTLFAILKTESFFAILMTVILSLCLFSEGVDLRALFMCFVSIAEFDLWTKTITEPTVPCLSALILSCPNHTKHSSMQVSATSQEVFKFFSCQLVFSLMDWGINGTDSHTSRSTRLRKYVCCVHKNSQKTRIGFFHNSKFTRFTYRNSKNFLAVFDIKVRIASNFFTGKDRGFEILEDYNGESQVSQKADLRPIHSTLALKVGRTPPPPQPPLLLPLCDP